MDLRISVCIPAYNGSKWILEAVKSVLVQTYPLYEVLIVDDCSTDGTLNIVRSIGDPRIRIERNDTNLGLVGNWNQCVRLARGDFIKFLFQDDVLYPACCERMVELFRRYPSLGMAFSRRDVFLENPDDPGSRRWLERHAVLDNRFADLREFNHGAALFAQYFRKRFAENFVGEPSSVMVRKRCFERLGLFNIRMHQNVDVEMWLRIMYYYDVGFIEQPLSLFRVHASSMSQANSLTGRAWLDPIWLIEGLLEHSAIRSEYKEIAWRRYIDAMYVLRWQLQRLLGGKPIPVWARLRDVAAYVRFRLQRLSGTGPLLHPQIGC